MVLTSPVLFAASTTNSTDSSSGSLQVSGGAGIVKNLYVGQNTTSSQLTSSIGLGTQPLVVSSSMLVPILYVARSVISDTTSSFIASGPITINGPTSSVTSQTGSGTVFVTSTGPTLITPYIGSGNGTSLGLIGSMATTLVNTSVVIYASQQPGLLIAQLLVGSGNASWTNFPLSNVGLQLGWNNIGGSGAADFLANTGGGNTTAFSWWYTNSSVTTPTLISTLSNTGLLSSSQYLASGTSSATGPTVGGGIISQGGIGIASNLWIGSAYTSTNTTTAGSVINVAPFTYTSSTLNPTNFNTVTVNQVALNSVGIASTTATATSLYISGAPASSGSMNITNPFSLQVAAGPSYFASSGGLGSLSCKWLIVGGGGSGGYTGGGGGGGGYVINNTPTTLTGSYLILVGSGGPAVFQSGTMGSPSSIGTIAAIGGGSGGAGSGKYGASGGGAANGTGNVAGVGYPGQGSAGGSNVTNAAGGGGGAGAVGGNATTSTGGVGGNGLTTSISGSSVTYSGGGGGTGVGSAGAGGSGGGGAGSIAGTGTAGTANTGGGGGGGFNGGSGGSGIVIITYPGTVAQATGGSITVSGTTTIHTFTSSGTFTILNNSITSIGSVAIGGPVSIAGPIYLYGSTIQMPNIYTQSIVFAATTTGTITQTSAITPLFVTGYPVAYASNGDYIANAVVYTISCTILNSTNSSINSNGDYATQVLLTYFTNNTSVFRTNISIIYYTTGHA